MKNSSSLVEPDMRNLVDLLYEHDLLADKEEWAKTVGEPLEIEFGHVVAPITRAL